MVQISDFQNVTLRTNSNNSNYLASSKPKKGLNQFENCNFNICEGCCTHIEDVYQFNIQCVNSLNRLKELLKKGTEKNELKNDNSNTKTAFISIKEEADVSTDHHFELVVIDDIKKEIFTEEDENDTKDKLPPLQTPNNLVHISPKPSIRVKNFNSMLQSSKGTIEATEEAKTSSADSKFNDNKEKIIIKKKLIRVINLTAHKRVHTSDKPSKCEVCGTTFKSIQYLNQHLKMHSNMFKCSVCKCKLGQKDLIAHMKTHEETVEKVITQNNAEMKKNLTEHKHIHTSDKPYKCKVCGSTFSSIRYLNLHSISHSKTFECSICKCEFGQKDLIAHMKTHEETAEEDTTEDNSEQPNLKEGEITSAGKQQTCEFCDRFFKRPTDLIEHRRTHTGERPYKCKECPKAFKRPSHLELHLKTHRGIKPFKCNTCDRSFTQKSNLNTHMLLHLEEKERPKFICEVCGKHFTQKDTLRNHSLIHANRKDIICEVCGAQCRNKRRLYIHMRTHSENRLMYSCKVCNRSFTTSTSLKNHTLRAHTNEKPYECEICKKTFSVKLNLNAHMKVHSGEKPYACKFCCRSFLRSATLKQHIMVHTGEKPYACDMCDKSFPNLYHLNMHKLVHTGKKLHCDICNKKYVSPQGLAKHKRKHHKH